MDQTLSRRAALKLGFASLGVPVAARSALSQPEPPPSFALRTPDNQNDSRSVSAPTLPSLGVIAFNRVAFGPRPDDLVNFLTLGATPEASFQAYVEQQLNPASIDDSACETRLAGMNLTTLTKSLEQLWADHVVNNTQGYAYRILPLEEVELATFIRAVYSERQLVEVLADFWHNHFNTYGWHYSIAPVFVHFDRDVIRPNLLGNFRQLVGAVATSPAMLYYLDNYVNQVAGFNENYARELVELHTLGAENYLGVGDPFDVPKDTAGFPLGYVDNDVYEIARCFTGWRVDSGYATGETGVFWYYDSWHDRANKFVLGNYLPADQPPMKDGNDVLDILASHPGTARHIARKLCRRLIADDPPESIVTAAADVFHANVSAPDQLKQVVRTVLLSDEFRATWGEKIKRPFEFTVSFLRALNANFTPSGDFLWNYGRMGQDLFSHTPPDGYSDLRTDWLGTTSLLHRWRLVNSFLEGWIDDTTLDLVSQTPAGLRTPYEIVDYWVNRIHGHPLSMSGDRDTLVEFMAQGRNPDYDLPEDLFLERTPRMVALLCMAPDFQYR